MTPQLTAKQLSNQLGTLVRVNHGLHPLAHEDLHGPVLSWRDENKKREADDGRPAEVDAQQDEADRHLNWSGDDEVEEACGKVNL